MTRDLPESDRPRALSAAGRPAVLHSLVLPAFLVLFLLAAGCSSGPVETPSEPASEAPGSRLWLERLDDRRTRAWVAERDARAREVLEAGSRERILRTIEEMQEVEGEPTEVIGDFLVRREEEAGAGRPVVRFARPGGPWRVLLDPDALGLPADAVVSDVRPSPDGRLVAFGVSAPGLRLVTVRVADVEEQRLLADRVEGVKYDPVSWAGDSRSFVYSRFLRAGSPGAGDDGENDAAATLDRGSLVAVHRIGTRQEDDLELIASDPETVVEGYTPAIPGPERRLLVVTDWSSAEDAQNLLVMDLGDPGDPDWSGELVPLLEARRGHHRVIGGTGRSLVLQTSLDAPRQRIVAVELDDPGRWHTLVPEDERPLMHSAANGGRVAVSYRRDVRNELEVVHPASRGRRAVELPGLVSTWIFRRGPEEDGVSFFMDSFTTPPANVRLDLVSGQMEPRDASRSPLSGHVTVQRFATSDDGTRVPWFLVHGPEGLSRPAPTLLYGYGASRGSLEPEWSAEWATWLRLGGRLVVANVRGGAEYGEAWHEAGRLENKTNSFDDFAAVARAVVADGVARTDQLVAYGSSNGGLLVGATMARYPDVFGTALIDVGVLDAIRFPHFSAGPRWAGEMGDARDPGQYAMVLAWSPLHNLEEGTCYPATLVTTAWDDDVVHPSQSFRYFAELEAVQGCDRPVLLRAWEGGGHGPGRAAGLYAQRAADRLAFAARQSGLGVEEPSAGPP